MLQHALCGVALVHAKIDALHAGLRSQCKQCAISEAIIIALLPRIGASSMWHPAAASTVQQLQVPTKPSQPSAVHQGLSQVAHLLCG